MTPYEILAGPYTLYAAPVATAFPVVTAAPAGGWVKIGTGGDRNYSEDGVKVSHRQSFDEARPAGALGPVKAWRTSEDLLISLTLWDISLEQYQFVLNGATITTTAAATGVAGKKTVGLSRAADPVTYALLVRGLSPYGDSYVAQYEVPRCYQSANAEPVYRKGRPAGLDLQFTALEDAGAASADQRFGRLVQQHAAPLP